ncbi:amidase [Roseomonas sp. E05]|uniref:amidase n=1 Tax=Roseomonas sp. E05 TaxID=3046310 RepID=UPI0024BA61D8|nr:amidase [Roseomonas sp. E05]MDJ0390472.1 amidase [Roseomonas sp. E05]
MNDDLHALTIAELSRRIRVRDLSPVELTQACIARVKALDGQLNSFILLLEEQALAEARKAEAEIAAGDWKGPLHGIPIGLKDIYNTAGVATTGHSGLFRDHVPAEDATTVRLLREAGAVILGKTATWEFAIGGSSFDLPWPPARNPWNTALDTSGSSSGSAAAVAAGLVPGSTGSDTGGSIRGPAAWCGIAGHKPTYGLVSRRGILPLSFSLDHGGPMCWTAEDCALMMQALAAHDPLDAASADPGPIDFAGGIGQGIAGLRIGVVRHFFETDVPCEPEVLATFEATLRALQAEGATVRDVILSPFGVYGAVGSLISRSEAFAIHEPHLRATPELYGEYGRRRLMAGAFVRAGDYVNAMRHRSRLVAEVAEAMKAVDVLVFPTSRQTAGPLGEDSMSGRLQPFFNRAFNVTGGPALSVCNGFSAAGLPIALHVGGRPFEDDLVLRVGDAVERIMGTRTRRPALAESLQAAAE